MKHQASTATVDQPQAQERRRNQRHLTLMRVGLIHTSDDTDFCIVRNISADGLKARVYRLLKPGANVRIELTAARLLNGRIVWSRGYEIGVAFQEVINIDEALSGDLVGETDKRPRLPRLNLNCTATLRQGARSFRTNVINISPRGLRIGAPDGLIDDTAVVLTLPDLPPISATIRWAEHGEAGLLFNECLPFWVLADWVAGRLGK